MPAGNPPKTRLVAFIDPPLTNMPLERWRQFLASMQSLPQDDERFRDLAKWAQAVVDWKTSGEKGQAPERIKPVLGSPPRAPQP